MKFDADIRSVYDAHSGRLYNLSLRILGEGADAEEVMHDTLLQYHEISRRDEINDVSKWLSSVCIRKSIDRLRKRHRYMDFLERYAEQDCLYEPDVMADEVEYSVAKIKEAMASLPDQYRLVLTLNLFEGYDYQEISQITQTKESTIRTLYMRGRRKLADKLGGRIYG